MWQIRKPTDEATPEEAAERTEQDRRLMTVGDAGAFAPNELHTELKVELHQRLLGLINLSALEKMSRAQIEEEVGDIVLEELDKQRHALNHAERKQLVGDVLDELLGLGPIEPLLKDATITDILINGHDCVFVERYGVLEPSAVRFKDERHLVRIIQKIVSAVGRRVDESSPMVDARLADGSRVNAVVPPLALDGSLLSIRKFAKTPISMARLVEIGSVPAQVAEVMKAVVAARLNVLISGGTGSGKTTMLNAMSAFIDNHERIVTIEDSAELQLQQEHVARLETRPANIEGKGEIAQRDLVKNSLRMRPDRIIVGEVRSGPCQLAPRCPVPRRTDDRHERNRHSGPLRQGADLFGHPRRDPDRPPERRPAQAGQPLRVERHGRRCDHNAGNLPLPADGHRVRRHGPGKVRGHRYPPTFP
jgi:pilus assembly protein CpaF